METEVKESLAIYAGTPLVRSTRKGAGNAPGLLGLTQAGVLEALGHAEAGFGFGVVERLGRDSGMPVNEIAQLARIPPRTFARRKHEGQFTPAESDRVLRASRVLSQAIELFEGDRAAALRWLNAPQRAFAGKTPISIARTDAGAREVENLIGRLEYGVFS